MTNTTPIELVCPGCGALNRIPGNRLADNPVCGKCHGPLMTGQPIAADDRSFGRFVEKNGLPVVVDFWASWCGPCRQFAPAFEQVAAEMATRVSFLKLDTEVNPQTAARYRIRSIPTLILFNKGREVTRLSGALPKSRFQQWLNEQLSGSPA